MNRLGWLGAGVGLLGLMACQFTSGLSDLTASVEDSPRGGDGGGDSKPYSAGKGAAGAEDSGTGAAGGGNGGGSAGGVGGGGGGGTGGEAPDCGLPEDVACDLYTDCGCMKGETCQARGSEYKATCVKQGPVREGFPCKNADECAKGTCDQGLCRSYCRDSCESGQCVAARGADGKPVEGLSVCARTCQIGKNDNGACREGSNCRLDESSKIALCLPPENPCSKKEDGHCDEPLVCATGTDTVDCSCETSIEGADCDLVSQCGCDKKKSLACQPDNGKPVCTAEYGKIKLGELCMDVGVCEAGTGCYGNPYGLCKEFCNEDTDCAAPGDKCVETTRDGKPVPGVSVCSVACSETLPCKANAACTFVASRNGYFCYGCKPEYEGGECNIVQQCGCDLKSGTSCQVTAKSGNVLSTACLADEGHVLPGGACGSNDDCANGLLCLGHICRRPCDHEFPDTCEKGMCAYIVLTANNQSLAFGACYERCDATSCGSEPGVKCLPQSVTQKENGNYVNISVMACALETPLTMTCPTNNQRCDDPTGTGLCAAGADAADCASSM